MNVRAALSLAAMASLCGCGGATTTSVLNAHNQVWDAPNVFVTDGACMTSTANQNPSITYMALTARAVDYAVKQLNRREL